MKLAKALLPGLLALALMGAAVPDTPSPRDPYPGEPGPTCYGTNGWYHVWNLFTPQEVYMVDSCVAQTLIATRDLAGNYALYVSLASAKVPLAFPVALYAMAWQTGNGALRTCASKGTGVEFVQDSKTGQVIMCRAQ
jgi:putative hemolysin